MDWTDDGIVVAARRHGEASVVARLLTRAHGLHAGLVRGGAGSKARGVYQPGNVVAARWRARLAEHLGTFTCEPVRSHGAALLDDPLGLAGLSAACALLAVALPERHPYPALYDGTLSLIEAIGRDAAWPARYVRWELDLLRELGFGLDLTKCAATGATDDLAYVSPKSGRAVSRAAGADWRHRLLPLPGFLIGAGDADKAQIADGLALCASFLDRCLFAPHERKLPPARERFVERFTRTATTSGGIVAHP